MFKKIKSFAFCFLTIICSELNFNAMECPTYILNFNIMQTPHKPVNINWSEFTFGNKKTNNIDLNECKKVNYTVIYKYELPFDIRQKAPIACSMCKGDFQNSNFHSHSTNIKLICTSNKDNNPQAVDCIFIPLDDNLEINDISELLTKYKSFLCSKCMKKYIEYYLTNAFNLFVKNHPKYDYKLLCEWFINNNLFPQEYRNSKVNVCWCGNPVELNSFSSIVMCQDNHWCHKGCFHYRYNEGKAENDQRTICPWPCNKPLGTVVPYFNAIEIIKEISNNQVKGTKLDFDNI